MTLIVSISGAAALLGTAMVVARPSVPSPTNAAAATRAPAPCLAEHPAAGAAAAAAAEADAEPSLALPWTFVLEPKLPIPLSLLHVQKNSQHE